MDFKQELAKKAEQKPEHVKLTAGMYANVISGGFDECGVLGLEPNSLLG